MISTEAAKEIGETERSKLVNTKLEWPDCGTVTRNIIDTYENTTIHKK